LEKIFKDSFFLVNFLLLHLMLFFLEFLEFVKFLGSFDKAEAILHLVELQFQFFLCWNNFLLLKLPSQHLEPHIVDIQMLLVTAAHWHFRDNIWDELSPSPMDFSLQKTK